MSDTVPSDEMLHAWRESCHSAHQGWYFISTMYGRNPYRS